MEYLKNKVISKSNYKIKIISAKDTCPIRHAMLRQGKPIATCVFVGDELDSTFHLGAFNKDLLIGICSLYKNQNKHFKYSNQYQIRGMAVLIEFQGKGVGFNLIKYAQEFLYKKRINLVWCNARTTAINFYIKNGFSIQGSEFVIEGVGPHYVMYKNLRK